MLDSVKTAGLGRDDRVSAKVHVDDSRYAASPSTFIRSLSLLRLTMVVISTAGRTAKPVARTTQRAASDGDNERIPQSVGGDDNVGNIESDSERNVHDDWVSDCAKNCGDTDSQQVNVGQLVRAGDCGGHRNGGGRGRGGHDGRCQSAKVAEVNEMASDEGLQGSIVSSKPKRTAKQVSATKIPKTYVPEAHGPPLEGVGMCKQ